MISCQDLNSNTTDAFRYGGNGLDPNATDLEKANYIIKQKCVACHTGYHNNWINNTTNEAWIDTGMVIRGDASNSFFIDRIINTGLPASNMPQGGSPLEASEYQQLLDWINNMP